jgi:hypothetical protein
MTYREKFALLEKENKLPIEELFFRYYMFQLESDMFSDYDKEHISKEVLLFNINNFFSKYIKVNDINIINNYKKDDDVKEFCMRMYNFTKQLNKCDGGNIEKIRNLYINACYEDYNYIIRKQKRTKFRKTIKRKRVL